MLLEEVIGQKNAMVKALELTQKEVESMHIQLNEKDELLKAKDAKVLVRQKSVVHTWHT